MYENYKSVIENKKTIINFFLSLKVYFKIDFKLKLSFFLKNFFTTKEN